jgi:hypothetical protein
MRELVSRIPGKVDSLHVALGKVLWCWRVLSLPRIR